MDHPLLNPLTKVSERLGVSRSTVFNEIAAGRLAVVKIGRRSFVTEDELNRFVQDLPSRLAASEG